MPTTVIRTIKKKDNPEIAQVIRSVLLDFNVPKVGTAYADKSLDCMFETYQQPKSIYFVVEKEEKIIGGAGIAPLQDYDQSVCELQKMYFLPEARGKGLGAKMMNKCLESAKHLGFTLCYLETMHYMKDAQKLYQKFNFKNIEGALGNTGHFSCGVHMLLSLQ